MGCVQVGKLEGLESDVDQLQRVLQSVATELESGHQTAQVRAFHSNATDTAPTVYTWLVA